MKKKLCSIILALILLIQPAFSLAQTSQPPDTQSDVCGAPGETMLLYQKFQRDISSALLGGVLGEKIFQTEFSVRGLFTSETLRLPTTGNNALDTVISTLRNNSRRLGSATVTTTVLLALAGASVVSSNLEGFAILFQNRAIVRDWRSLLQIETRISQIAYSLGKRANLIGTLNEDGGALQAIVQQYVNEGLFTGEVRTDKTTYSAILTSLTRMNAGMKMFLSFRNTSFLSNFGTFYGAKFNPEALANLKKEYTGAR
ncbi:MAG: hypothetical protein LBO09_05980 [Candidatus Peribacteria bacterium]|jgi:hypothetical protein|nr:hypothetical protein [Candidatus Peribacteria bacterium]